jgi:hypothetical protein
MKIMLSKAGFSGLCALNKMLVPMICIRIAHLLQHFIAIDVIKFDAKQDKKYLERYIPNGYFVCP